MTTTQTDSSTVEFGRRQCVLRIGSMSARASWRAIIVVTALLVGAVVAAVLAIGIGK